MAAPKLSAILKGALASGSSKPFDRLLEELSADFKHRKCFERLKFKDSVGFGWPKEAGVYVIHRKSRRRAVYVGMAGRLGEDGAFATKGGLNKRVHRWTPYHFDARKGAFQYRPKKPSSNTKKAQLEAGYKSSIPFKELDIDCFKIGEDDRLGPAVVEALLLQAHLEQHGCLPEANRQF